MNIQFKSTLEKYENFLKVRNYSKNTIEVYSSYLKLFLSYYTDKSPAHLTQKDFESFIYSFNFTSISQQNQLYSSIKLFYENILKSKLTQIILTRPRKEKRLPQIIDKEYLLKSISKIENLKHKAIISLAYSTGMRVSEVINLKIENIDSKRMLIHVIQAKGRKDRDVPLSPAILDLLRKYFRQYRPKTYLFNGQDILQYSANSCNQIVKKYLGKDYHFHLLRHSCFTHLLESGTDCRIIQSIAGHSNIKTTEGYMHVSTNLLSKVVLPI